LAVLKKDRCDLQDTCVKKRKERNIVKNFDGNPKHTTEDTQIIYERIILNMDRKETVNRTKWQKRIEQ